LQISYRAKKVMSNSQDKDQSLRVSVIIPTYYRFHELSCLFDSLLEQSVKPEEIIVVDDTPTPDINTLCEKYASKFNRTRVTLVYFRNDRERSISIARNLGRKIARGNILMFLDSDVVLYPDYIENMQSTLKKYPEVLGVGGWLQEIDFQFLEGVRFQTMQIFYRMFFLWHFSRNSGKIFEYPFDLSNPIYSEYLNGQSLSVRSSVFNEFQFDENLKGYSWMEDFLFSVAICRKYPKSLLITPDAKYTHNSRPETRPKGKNLVDIKIQNRKYVLIQLWGFKGLLLFGWQTLGILILKVTAKFLNRKFGLSEV
jgi:glucosyl-dolichyl phosphate glucuronosyltransferase